MAGSFSQVKGKDAGYHPEQGGVGFSENTGVLSMVTALRVKNKGWGNRSILKYPQ